MRLFGVVNASPDSLNVDSIATDATSTAQRAEMLIAQGVWGFDVGGQGSTFQAGETTTDEEWSRLSEVIPTLVSYGLDVSVDTWRPETARRALDAGVTWLNAADGLQSDEMLALAAEYECPVVLPFLSGPDPLRLDHVVGDPVEALIEFFDAALRRCDRFGIRHQMVIDPGTGFAPHNWPWEERYLYQKDVYSRLDELRVYDLPLYIALPWKDTVQHNELLDIVISRDPDYGRAHYPDRIVAAEHRFAAGAADER